GRDLYSTAMKTVMVGLLGLVILAHAQSGPPNTKTEAADGEAEVRTIVLHWQQSWDNFDPSVLQGDYADDADWLNAFGVRIKGSARIIEFVNRVVKRPNVQDRKTTWEEPVIRLVRPDVAVAYRDYKTVGHKTLDGKEMPQRITHSTWVLAKNDGRWRMESKLIFEKNGGPQRPPSQPSDPAKE